MSTWKFVIDWAESGFASSKKTIRGSKEWIQSEHERFTALLGRDDLPAVPYWRNEGREPYAILTGRIRFLGDVEEE